MKISSPSFIPNQFIPQTYTCQGENINPPLKFSDIPENTISLALVVDDPDAATDPKGSGSVFTHWLVWNIDPQIRSIEENSDMEGLTQGFNGRGGLGYTGPCPPTGVHRYRFKLYALNGKLSVSQNITREELEMEIGNSLIEKAEIVGLFKK